MRMPSDMVFVVIVFQLWACAALRFTMLTIPVIRSRLIKMNAVNTNLLINEKCQNIVSLSEIEPESHATVRTELLRTRNELRAEPISF